MDEKQIKELEATLEKLGGSIDAKLKEQAEKATGPEQIVITRQIEEKARKSRP